MFKRKDYQELNKKHNTLKLMYDMLLKKNKRLERRIENYKEEIKRLKR